jgi:hypothetical protein
MLFPDFDDFVHTHNQEHVPCSYIVTYHHANFISQITIILETVFFKDFTLYKFITFCPDVFKSYP